MIAPKERTAMMNRRLTAAAIATSFAGFFVLLTMRDATFVSAAPPEASAADKALKDKLNPFLDQFCNKCHNSDKQSGGVPLDIYKDAASARKDRKM